MRDRVSAPSVRRGGRLSSLRPARRSGDSLFGNSTFLLVNTIVLAAFGFLFWSISAHVYTATQVGLATALIAALNLITSFALVGLEISLIRFLPQSRDGGTLINSSLVWTAILAALCSAIFILVQPLIAPRLAIVHESVLVGALFILFSCAAAANYIVESVFISYQASRYVVVKNAVASVLKVGLPVALAFGGAFGLYSAWMVSLVLAAACGIWILKRRLGHRFAFTTRRVPTPGMRAFSIANYLATFAEGIPDMVLPLLVLDLLGAVSAAHYFIAMMLATLLFAVSAAAGQSLFAAGSQGPGEFRRHAGPAALFTASLLVPGILGAILLGGPVLHLFGADYARSAHSLLILFAGSSVLVAGNDALRAFHKVHLANTVMFVSSALGSAVAIGLCFPLAAEGLTGIGLAWCGGQIVTFVVLAFPFIASRVVSRDRAGLS